MWITPLCPRFAFVKLSVAKASLPHCNCPSDSRVYAAAGGEQTRGEGGGWGVTSEKKGGLGAGGSGRRDVARAKGRMRAVIYRLWV